MPSCHLRTALLLAASLAPLAPLFAQQPALLPGLPAVLFNDTALQRPAARSLEAALQMTLSGYHDCSKLWLGRLTCPVTATVSLDAEAAQGLRLYCDGRLVIDGWGPGEARRGVLPARAGEVLALRVEYYHLGGEACLRLRWSWPGQPPVPVPPSAFSHTAADLRHVARIAEGKELVAVGNRGPYAAPESEIVQAPAGDEEVCAGLYRPGEPSRAPAAPLRLGPGPHLLLDDELIASSSGLTRRVCRPARDPALHNPLVDGKTDHNYQPYLTVLQDPATRRFRMWYGCYGPSPDGITSHLGYLESPDGLHWQRPARVLADPDPIQFGSSVLDDGPGFSPASQRYKLAWWKDGGLKLATSPDGLCWTSLCPYPVLRHNHDINNLVRDPLRHRYVATFSVYTTGAGWSGQRRCTMQSTSADLLHWSKPWYILTPHDGLDEGDTQFYAMSGHLFRGGLWLGLVKVLRDDLRAPGTPEGSYGVGYTTLAWSRDGRHWVRDREPFFEPDPDPAAWDHAHAWMDWQVPVGEETLIYYGGYRSGHKVNRYEERQLGVVRIRRDRYVARSAGETEGVLRTYPLVLEAGSLTVNAQVRGELRVRVLDEAGQPLPGFDYADCAPLAGDGVTLPVAWKRSLAALRGKPVRLEFRLRAADLYAFSLS